MFISSAYAQAAGESTGGGSLLTSLLPLVLIFAIFYFLLIRPQQKKMKEHKAKVAAMRRGDKIVLSAGIIGSITKVIDDDYVMVEIADGVRVRVVRSMVQDVLAKTDPVPAKDKKGDSAEDEDEDDTDADDTGDIEAEDSAPKSRKRGKK